MKNIPRTLNRLAIWEIFIAIVHAMPKHNLCWTTRWRYVRKHWVWITHSMFSRRKIWPSTIGRPANGRVPTQPIAMWWTSQSTLWISILPQWVRQRNLNTGTCCFHAFSASIILPLNAAKKTKRCWPTSTIIKLPQRRCCSTQPIKWKKRSSRAKMLHW